MQSFILIHPTIWPQYTNVIYRTDRQRDRTVNGLIAQGEPFYKQSPDKYCKTFSTTNTTKNLPQFLKYAMKQASVHHSIDRISSGWNIIRLQQETTTCMSILIIVDLLPSGHYTTSVTVKTFVVHSSQSFSSQCKLSWTPKTEHLGFQCRFLHIDALCITQPCQSTDMHREWKKHARNINSIICCRKKPLLQTSAALRVSVDEQDQEDETCTPSEQQQHIFYHTLHRRAISLVPNVIPQDFCAKSDFFVLLNCYGPPQSENNGVQIFPPPPPPWAPFQFFFTFLHYI